MFGSNDDASTELSTDRTESATRGGPGGDDRGGNAIRLPREPLSEPANYCDTCGRITNRRGNCPDLSCPGTSE